jgi:hypothetical protein
MRSLTHWVLTTFASPLGILILAALDSTLFFWLPFGIDAATVVLSMRDGALDVGLERFAPSRSLGSARKGIEKKTRPGILAALSLVPPPFPFTPNVLAAGALEVKAVTFFSTLAACRFVRFGSKPTWRGAMAPIRSIGSSPRSWKTQCSPSWRWESHSPCCRSFESSVRLDGRAAARRRELAR